MLAYNISSHAVTSLVKDVLPAASEGGLLPVRELAADGRAVMNQMGEALKHYGVSAHRVKAVVCVKCGWPARSGVFVGSSAMCGNCPGRAYREMRYVRWPLKEQIAARVHLHGMRPRNQGAMLTTLLRRLVDGQADVRHHGTERRRTLGRRISHCG